MTQPERFARSWINILLLLISVAAGPVFADGDGPVPIGKILGDPEGYHLTGLTLRGTVSSLNALEPYYIPSGAVCYGAYTFQIEDDSGTLQMAIPGVIRAAHRLDALGNIRIDVFREHLPVALKAACR